MGFVLVKEIHRKINIVLAQTIRKKTFVVVVFTLNNFSPKYKEAKRFKVEQKNPRFSSFKLEGNLLIKHIPVTYASTLAWGVLMYKRLGI